MSPTHKANSDNTEIQAELKSLWTPKNDYEIRTNKQQIYDGYGHRHVTQFQKSKHLQPYATPKMTRNNKRFAMAMPQSKSGRSWKSKHLHTYGHLKITQKKNREDNRFTMAMAIDTQS